MTRFFVDNSEICKDFIVLTGENAAHAKVLRLKSGEQVVVCDGNGTECVCTISDVSAGQISLVVNHKYSSETEPVVQVSVYMAYAKGDKLEHVIQKATELGAFEIVAFPAARCVSKPDSGSIRKKLDRWQKIAEAAAEQSGRGYIPRVLAMNSYQEALMRGAKSDVAILFYENEQGLTLHNVLDEKEYRTVSVLTGPEGGLETREVQQATDEGFRICTLGKRILRCETAPLCAVSAIMFHSGEF